MMSMCLSVVPSLALGRKLSRRRCGGGRGREEVEGGGGSRGRNPVSFTCSIHALNEMRSIQINVIGHKCPAPPVDGGGGGGGGSFLSRCCCRLHAIGGSWKKNMNETMKDEVWVYLEMNF